MTIKVITLRWRHAFTKIGYWREDTKPFSNAGLEVRKFANLFFQCWGRDIAISNVDIDFVFETVVD